MLSFLVLLVLAFASLCSAQGQAFAELPNCAKSCATTLPAECNLDVKCICAKSSYISDIACCVGRSCPDSDITKALQVAQQLCSTVKVTLPNGVPDSCKQQGGGGASSSSAAAGAANTAASSAAGAGSSATAAASSMMSAAGGSATNSAVVASSSNGASCVNPGVNIGALGAAAIAAVLI